MVSPKISKEVWELCNFFNVDFKELNNLNIPTTIINLNELTGLKLQDKKELLHNKSENISFLHTKILKTLENFSEDGITTKHLAKILYPDRKFNSIRSTLSQYTSDLEKSGLVKKERLGKETFISIQDSSL